MSETRPLLDRIRLVSPCDAEWEGMTGTNRVRFCKHCDLSVHDVSAMTRRDAEALVRASKGRLCLRFHRDETGRVRTLDTAPLVPLTRRATRMAAGAMALAFVAGAAVPAAQGTVRRPPAAVAPHSESPSGGTTQTVSGAVQDEQGAVVVDASVTLTNVGTGATIQANTDDNGRYSFEVAEGTYTILVEASGFKRTIVDGLDVRAGESSRVDLNIEVSVGEALTGVVAVASPADMLVMHDAEREARGIEGAKVPPAIEALDSRSVESIAEAIRVGGSVDARGTFGETALMYLIGDKAYVKALLAAGADVNARDDFGVTPLIRAALYDDPKVVKRLIAAGADVNAGDKDGLTALMAAALDGNGATVKALLRAGADVHARDSRGKTAMAYALEVGAAEIVKTLEAAGASE